ncbi:MAG: carbamoyl-phosphate synthase large subunit, partial [Acidobacteriia bacterium]|nr:carbamoyl-phosphate synthase large subunit [Terriglobia bacterium]
MKLLIANRGEIAIRIALAAADLGIESVAVYSEDDDRALHIRRADHAVALVGSGAGAYLDAAQLIQVAADSGCDALHPGYGFLSESAAFARECLAAGLTFVGPPPEALALFGDKAQARALAEELGVPVVQGVSGPTTLAQAGAFFESLPGGSTMLIKAVAGGGGRGIRLVSEAGEIENAMARAQSEAGAAFGVPDVFVERFVAGARHVETQIAVDHEGRFACIGDRDCSLQRRHQKLVEVAPAPGLPKAVRSGIADASALLAEAAGYRNLGTFEFLVDGDQYFFIEANARLQVEHTVTEETSGLDLVQIQLRLAEGQSIQSAGVRQAKPGSTRNAAVQARVNMETMQSHGSAKPSAGTLEAFDLPSGKSVRVDTSGYAGLRPSPNFDSLLAKVVGHASEGGLAAAMQRTARALADFRISGIETNIPFLNALLAHPEVCAWNVHTRFVDEHMEELVAGQSGEGRFFPLQSSAVQQTGMAGAKVDPNDPLAVLSYGKRAATGTSGAPSSDAFPDGAKRLRAAMQGTIVSVDAEVGSAIRADDIVLVMESMKMEHEIRAGESGILREVTVAVGDTVYEGHPLAVIEEREVDGVVDHDVSDVDLDSIRPDLAEVHARRDVTLDAARPDAVAKRRKTGQRTARENVDDLCDEGTFVEYGQLALTPGTGLARDEVIRKFPTDGMITGIGSVNGADFPGAGSRCVILAYDYT